MTEREALKLALDAFGEIAWSNETQWQRDRAKEAITAIKEALANVATNDTSQERVDKTSEIVHEPVTWVGLTDEEIDQGLVRTNYAMQTAGAWRDGVEWAEAKLKEKNYEGED